MEAQLLAHCLPLFENVGFKVPGFHDCGGILHLTFPISKFTGVSGQGDSPFQHHHGQMTHLPHGGELSFSKNNCVFRSVDHHVTDQAKVILRSTSS